MTFTSIVDRVMDRLKLSSDEARSRVEDSVNDAHREVTSALGMDTSRKVLLDITVTTGAYPDLPVMEITGIEKIFRIQRISSDDVPTLLKELTLDSLTQKVSEDRLPNAFAIYTSGADSVTIQLDAHLTTSFDLRVLGLDSASDLEGNDSPLIPASFHDVLVLKALWIETMLMEKDSEARRWEQEYLKRLGQLTYFLNKSAYLTFQQGSDNPQLPPSHQ